MSNANLLITLLTIFFCCAARTASSADKGVEPIEEVGLFRAHMLDHPYKGCPTNSLCQKKTGELRMSWISLLKSKKPISALEKFRRTQGIPLNIWTRDKVLKHPQLILWDSFCPKHNPKPSSEGLINTDQKIYIAQAWSKDFNEVKKNFKEADEILINRAYLLKEDKTVETFMIPRAEAPLLLKDGKLYFTIEEEGNYFGLWIKSDGTLRVDKTYLPKKFPNEVKCPEALSKAFQAGVKNPNLFQGFFCKTLWNQSLKKLSTIAIGWSCN